ncbi:hypothetical protein JCM8547_004106 [Rhodosporidiobolus lusitaniae]
MPFLPRLLLLTLVAVLPSSAAPSPPNLVYPLQAQLPPVARVNETWTWTLLPGTFNASSGSTLTLSTRSLPSWCEFDATSETFTGLPLLADLGSSVVTVTANVTGVARGRSDSFTLLVVDPAVEPKPYVRLPLADQVASAAAVSGGGTLTPDGALKVPPQWSFSFGFQQYTFENAERQKIYYEAYEEGTTSLPSWVEFDNATVTFGGLAPSENGEYAFTFFGSERYGYGDVQQTLRLVVAEHSFELLGAAAAEMNGSTVLPAVEATPGGPVKYTIPLDQFRIDNSTISSRNLSSVTADLSHANLLSYLSFSFANLSLSGEIPFSFEPTEKDELLIPLTLVDQYNNALHTNLSLEISASLFDTSLFPQTIDVKQGEEFSQSLSPFFTSTTPSSSSSSRQKRASTDPDASFSATISPLEAQQWISFSPSDLRLVGTAPAEIPAYQNATVEILASPSSNPSLVSRAEFVFSVVTSSTNTTTTHPRHPSSSHGLSHSAQLGLGLGLGLGGGLLLLAILAFCCWKKRKEAGEKEGEDERKMRRDTSQQLAAYSPNPAATNSTVTVVGGSPYLGKEKEEGEKEQQQQGGLAPPVPGAEGMALPLHQQQRDASPPKGPRRFDVMGMLFRSESGWSAKSAAGAVFRGGGGKKGKPPVGKEDVSYPRPALPQESSLFGLGIDDDEQPHQVVIVAGEDGQDGRRATTYQEHSDPAALAARAGTPSSSGNGSRRGGPGRVSSWESGGSSSLFYSDRSAASPIPSSQGSGLTSSPASSGRRRANRPPSIPHRRRDFLPLPLASPTASPNASPVPSPTRDTYDVTNTSSFYAHHGMDASLERDDSQGGSSSGSGGNGGIRIVGSHSDSTSGGSDPYPTQSTNASLPHVASFQQYSSPSRSGSYPSDSPSNDSLPAPRLIPFASERPTPPFSRTLTSQSSLRARGLDPDAIEDAEEDIPEGEEGEWGYEEGPSGVSAVSSTRRRTGIRPASGVYHGEGIPEESVVYYGPEEGNVSNSQEHPNPRETWRSPSGFADSVYSYDEGEESGVRYVGSVASTSVAPSPFLRDGQPKQQEADRASGSYYEPPTPRSDVFSRFSTATTAPTPTSPAFNRNSSQSQSSPAHKRASSSHSPIYVPITVNVPFRFTPRLASPPFVSISSSPGRGGPPRATYHAFVENPPLDDDKAAGDEEEEWAGLPDFLHFDGGSIEMFGLARRGDVGIWRVVVVERKVMRTPGSPTRSGSPTRGGRVSPDKEWEDVTEQVVGRFELTVAFGDGGQEFMDGEDEGELKIVTY